MARLVKHFSLSRTIVFLIPMGLLLPLFFQFNAGVFTDITLNFDSKGILNNLPLPLSIVICYLGIVLLKKNVDKNSFLSFSYLISTCILMSLVMGILFTQDHELAKKKFLAFAQFILPMGAIVLGQFYEKENQNLLCEKAFFLTLFATIPLQFYFSFKRNVGYLTPDAGFFSIYQALQYVPVIFISAYLIALFNLWPIKKWRWILCVFSPLMAVYAAASISRLAIVLLFLGMLVFVLFQFKRQSKKLPAVLLLLMLAINQGYFHANEKALKFKFPIAEKTVIENNNSADQNIQQSAAVGPEPIPKTEPVRVDKSPITTSKSVTERLDQWAFYGTAITSDYRSFLLGTRDSADHDEHPSAHNYYLDFIYSFGVIALLPTLLLIAYTAVKLVQHRSAVFSSAALMALSVNVLFLLIVDNFFKVGMKQPYPGIFTFFLWGVLLAKISPSRRIEA